MRMEFCPDCARLTIGDCGKHMSPAAVHVLTGAAFSPPPVCTGTGTIAVDLQGMTMCSAIPTDGQCGICGGRYRVDGYQLLVTHPYLPLGVKP